MPRKTANEDVLLDRLDRAILRIVQYDNKTPQRAIAERVGLSAAAVQRRIAAMEAAGVITRNVAILDRDALGATITAVVEVQLKDERAATVDAAKRLFVGTPEVQQCYYVTGGISFVLIIIAQDMRRYEQLTRTLFNENELISSFRSLLALKSVKTDTAVVIP